MKIFLSWSGPQSRAVAEALNHWLPRVIQAVEPFYSPEIEKGARWSSQMDEVLEGTRFGIICLTPDNLESRWVHYEAGALSKTTDALVWTFLLDLQPGDVLQPLGRFQHTVAVKEDVLRLVRTINGRLAEDGHKPLPEARLQEIFDDAWPRLEAKLQEARGLGSQQLAPRTTDSATRDPGSMFQEILELLRDQERRWATEEGARDSSIEPPVETKQISALEILSVLNQVTARLDAEFPDLVESIALPRTPTQAFAFAATSITRKAGRTLRTAEGCFPDARVTMHRFPGDIYVVTVVYDTAVLWEHCRGQVTAWEQACSAKVEALRVYRPREPQAW